MEPLRRLAHKYTNLLCMHPSTPWKLGFPGMGWLGHIFDTHQLSGNYLLDQLTHTSYFMCIKQIRLLCIFLPRSKTPSSSRVENSNQGNYSPCTPNPSAARSVAMESLQRIAYITYPSTLWNKLFSRTVWLWYIIIDSGIIHLVITRWPTHTW